ncbi:MAG: DNA-binding transcriptional LysR family regulator [Psychrobacter glaciei]
MDTELLKTFLEVCNTRHFGKAAENLYVTQAAVSSRIKQLESRLGLELFSRLRNNIKLTPAGERLIPHAEAVLNTWQRAFQEVAITQKQNTQLALGGSPNVWDLMLQNSLYELKLSKPELAIRAEVLSHTVVTRQLLERSLDLALVFDSPKVDEIITVKLFQLPLELVSTKDNLNISDITSVGYIMLDWGTLFSIQHAKLCKQLPPPTLHTNIARVALDYMLQAGGAAYLPTRLVEPYIKNKQLFRVNDAPDMHRDVFASYHKDNVKTDLMEEVVALFKRTGSQVAPSLIPE